EELAISFTIQEEHLGTANAIATAREKLPEDFIVLNGDDFCTSDHLENIISNHNSKATMSVIKKENPVGLGVVEVEGNKVRKIVEKPPNVQGEVFVNIGIYAFSPDIFDIIDNLKLSERGEYEITDAIQTLVDSGEQVSSVEAEMWMPVNYPWDLLTANKKFINEEPEEIKTEFDHGVTVKGKLIAGEGTFIKAGVYIEGPVMIGKNCIIGPNAFLRPYTCIGDNCKIGQGVEVKNSVIMDGTCIPHLSYMGDSVVGRNVNFGAGAIMTNLRHDNKNILVNMKGKQVDSGLRKLGGLVGDDVKFGSNVVVNPGKKIGSKARIWPGVVVNNDVESGEEYKG
ncbi:MAG: sugar phosphate nucleotidyltransferase, partial [Candidatus Undinarchaeales archaeon]|nr:sugar phosphate nucleotidyltransferase [Candidatus Undinarchaeales archaeon]